MPPPSKKLKSSSSTSSAVPSKPVQQQPGGDDLEDNFALEDDFAPGSPAADEAAFSEGEGGAEYDNVDEDSRLPVTTTTTTKGKKRAADEQDDGDKPEGGKKKKAKKQNERKKAKVAEQQAADKGREYDETARLPVEAVADRLAEKQRKALGGEEKGKGKGKGSLSALELEEMRISQTMIQDTSSVESRKSLLEFMKEALPVPCTTLSKMPKAPGSPRIIVLSGAALRVADLCREVKGFRTKTKDGVIDVAKLFSKHFKLSEHVEYMSKTHVGIAVGTPNRIEKLLNGETESLHLTYTSHLILDTSHLDAKKRSLLDSPEAREDLFKLLGSAKVMERLREGKMKVVCF
ncbi:hypothetical protein JCM8547_003384 [Rhodosporidiobolus lusitaniae]